MTRKLTPANKNPGSINIENKLITSEELILEMLSKKASYYGRFEFA